MKKFRIFMALMAVVSIFALSSCGKDEDKDLDDDGGEVTTASLVGTWKMTDINPYDNEYVDVITFTKDGSVEGRFFEGYGEYSNFTGAYSLKGDKLTVYAVWVDEFDGDEMETWECEILSLSSKNVTLRIENRCTMKFKRVDGGEVTTASLVGTWKMTDINPYDNEYVDVITFTKDGSVEGRFLEGDGEYSNFTGAYSLKGDKLTVYAVWVDEFDGDEMETWECEILSLSSKNVTLQIENSCIMKFKRVK